MQNKNYKNIVPEADSESNSAESFFYRKVYDNIEKINKEQKSIIDLREKIKFGRVNEENFSIFPKEKYLKFVLPIETKKKIKLFNFVCDAFEEFREFWLEFSGCPDETNIKDLIPVRGWENVNVLYRNFIEKVYSNFILDFVVKKKHDKKIINFVSFLKLFLSYYEQVSARIPLTRSKFLTTKFASPHISGLLIETANEDHTKDVNKFNFFIEDSKFTFLKNAAIRFGFFIDKDAPWRFVADIKSPAMKKYLDFYQLNSDNLFKNCFYLAELHDLEILKKIIFNFYNSFVFSFPVFKIPREHPQKRKILTAEEMNKLTPEFWLEFLFKIKILEETGKNLPEHKFNILLKKILDKQKYVDFNSALLYTTKLISSIVF